MIRTNRWIVAGWSWVVVPLLAACGGGEPSSVKDGPSTSTQSLWGCATKNSRVVCTAPVTDEKPPAPAYACGDDARVKSCPGADAVRDCKGLKELLSTPDKIIEFTSTPWACLVTGKHQVQCARDLPGAESNDGVSGGYGTGTGTGTAGSGEGTGTGEYGGGGSPGTGTGTGTGGGTSGSGGTGGSTPGCTGCPAPKPTIPSTCLPQAWEPYFAQLATYQYSTHGVNITFPVEIFDVTGSMTDLSIQSGFVKSTPGAPSCHEGEQAMRQQAWLDAVKKGCTNLGDPILVMCQQAANYAPNTCACNATGAW